MCLGLGLWIIILQWNGLAAVLSSLKKQAQRKPSAPINITNTDLQEKFIYHRKEEKNNSLNIVFIFQKARYDLKWGFGIAIRHLLDFESESEDTSCFGCSSRRSWMSSGALAVKVRRRLWVADNVIEKGAIRTPSHFKLNLSSVEAWWTLHFYHSRYVRMLNTSSYCTSEHHLGLWVRKPLNFFFLSLYSSEYRLFICEVFPVSASCVTLSNPDLLSSRETGWILE